MKIFTLGTANRQHFEFTKTLNKYGIQVVLDIRRSPASPQAPQFNRDSLQMLCVSQKADYIYLGNELNRGLASEGCHDTLRPSGLNDRQGMARIPLKDWLASEEVQRTIKIIAAKAEKRVTCVLCSERLPSDCQRMFLAEEMSKLGFEIVHILDESQLWTPPAQGVMTPPARPWQFRPRRPSDRRTPHPRHDRPH